MLDKQGNLLTSDEYIINRSLEVYSAGLPNNKIKPHLVKLKNYTNTLYEIRLKISKKKTTDPWNLEDLKCALKQLKKDKSRDQEGFKNELFKETVAGDDLLFLVLNLIKGRQQYPKIFKNATLHLSLKKEIQERF